MLVSALPLTLGLFGRLGSEGVQGRAGTRPHCRSVVSHQSYGSSSAVVLKDPFPC